MKKNILILIITVCLLLAGCSKAAPESRPAETEPTAEYDWMAGESPVPVKRMGVFRYGGNVHVHAVSAKGAYFLDAEGTDSYILYADHGSDDLVKLCGRVDCSHDSPDCNAYIYKGLCLSYTGGYLYAVTGRDDDTQSELIRMEPEGSEHMVVLDLLSFAKTQGGDFVNYAYISDGVLVMDVNCWEVEESGSSTAMRSRYLDTYYYKLDGSMETPVSVDAPGVAMYSCGNVFLFISDAQADGQAKGIWSWDPDTNTSTYLTDHPGEPGYFDEDEGYFFRDGGIWRRTYTDQKDELMADTGLEGEYTLYSYPDHLLVVSNDFKAPDSVLYIYNWAFELVDSVEIHNPNKCMTNLLLCAETADRLILTDNYDEIPKYYINKSELGTGNVELYPFERVEQ